MAILLYALSICRQNLLMSDRIPPDRPPNPNFEKARALRGPLAAQLASYDAMLREGKIMDAKTILGLQWLHMNRDNLPEGDSGV